MKSVSALNNVHKLGLFGNYENKNDKNLIKVYNQNNKTNYDKKDIVNNLITRILYGGGN